MYEETSGLGPGAEVVTTGAPLSVELGPGLIENIYDGIQRPLEVIRQKTGGNFLPRGEEVPALDREKKWDFTAVAKVGDHLIGGDVLGTVQETPVDPAQDHDAAQDERHCEGDQVRQLHCGGRRRCY